MSASPTPSPGKPRNGSTQSGVDALLARADAGVLQTFTPEQLSETRRLLSMAVGKPGPKLVDLRFTIPLGFTRLYMVMLMGQDRRTRSRAHAVAGPVRWGNALAAFYLMLTFAMTISAFIVVGCQTGAEKLGPAALFVPSAPETVTQPPQEGFGVADTIIPPAVTQQPTPAGEETGGDTEMPADETTPDTGALAPGDASTQGAGGGEEDEGDLGQDAPDPDAMAAPPPPPPTPPEEGDEGGETGDGDDSTPPDSDDSSQTGDQQGGDDETQSPPPDETTSQPPPAPPAPPPPPLAPMPVGVRNFVGYTPDGGYHVDEGFAPNSTPMRDLMVQAIPKLATYGFGRYTTISYIGVARSDADATAYFAPVRDVAAANNIAFVPGFWMHHITHIVFGPADEAPWNVTGSNPEARHPMILQGLLQQAWWDEFVNRARILAHGAGSNMVYVDGEEVFWKRRLSPFWTDDNLAQIRVMARNAVAQLRGEGIYLSLYHPYNSPWVPNLRRIARGIYRPDDANDPLAFVEHMGTDPYFAQASWDPAEPSFVDNYYNNSGFFAVQQVRSGFISNHAAYPSSGLYGFTPQQYHDYCEARPGVAERTWYVAAHTLLLQQADQFEAIAMGQTPPDDPDTADASGGTSDPSGGP